MELPALNRRFISFHVVWCRGSVSRTPVLKWLATAFSIVIKINYIRLIGLNELGRVTSLSPALGMNATLALLHFLGMLAKLLLAILTKCGTSSS